MTNCLPVSKYAKHMLGHVGGSNGKQMSGEFWAISLPTSTSCYYVLRLGQLRQSHKVVTVSRRFSCSSVGNSVVEDRFLWSGCCKQQSDSSSFKVKSFISSAGNLTACLGLSSRCQNMTFRLTLPNRGAFSKVGCNRRSSSWLQGASTSFIVGIGFCFSSFVSVNAEASMGNNDENGPPSSVSSSSHGKKVYTDYSIIGIPGDGSCLFRSVVHGACLVSGKPSPSEALEKQLADELRARVADEFIQRREETEWFVEGDFDTYVSHIRKPHVWGGEPELFMASHVLQMPITVYMQDEDSGGLISIAEYGEEYGKENPIRVIYHGFGHYDALLIPGRKGAKSRL